MEKRCPRCQRHLNPLPTVDTIIHFPDQGIVLIKRRNFPVGWALPGGFVEVGETVEQAARRETLEETGLRVTLTSLLGVYSDPSRDPRQHTISTVFTARPEPGTVPRGGDDAAEAVIFPLDALPEDIVFDHTRIISDFIASLK